MRHSRSHTKSGPGRYHGQGSMFTTPEGRRIVADSKPRLPVAGFGGNWKGQEYFSYRELDQLKRMTQFGNYSREFGFRQYRKADALQIIRAQRSAA